MTQKGIFWLSLWQPGVSVLQTNTNTKINLLNLLRKTKDNVVDKNILLGATEQLAVRLVALRLPESITAEKRRKAGLAAKKSQNIDLILKPFYHISKITFTRISGGGETHTNKPPPTPPRREAARDTVFPP